MNTSDFSRLESGDLSVFTTLQPCKSPLRNWNSLHYACQYRSILGLISLLNKKTSVPLLSDLDRSNSRPCDLLPTPSLSHFNLYSYGIAPDYQLGYPKDKQIYPKKVDFHSPKTPIQYFIFRSVLKIASYKFHSLFITHLKEVWAFGAGRKGVLGCGNEFYAINPVIVPLKNVIQVAAGEMHSVCLTEERNVYVWGDNTFGQVIGVKAAFVCEPVMVKVLKQVYIDKIVSGKNHVVGFTGEKIYSWGCNKEKQLFCNTGDICMIQAGDLFPQSEIIIDVEAYDNYTAVLISGYKIVKSGDIKKVIHIPSNTELVKLCASAHSIHTISTLGVLFSLQLNRMGKNMHYKMQFTKEDVLDIFSGYYASAIDKNNNLWKLDPEPTLIKDISCVQSAKLNENFSLIISGIEKIPWLPSSPLSSLFEISQDLVQESIVNYIQNINTACELLLLSDALSCENLKLYCEYFITKNLVISIKRSYITIANWEYFSILDISLSQSLQNHLSLGKLPEIEENILKKSENKRNNKKDKRKPRAYSGNELNINVKCTQYRPRAATETQISVNSENFTKPLGELPKLKKDKPWGDTEKSVIEFNSLQKLEGIQPFSINKWENLGKGPADNFEIIQEVEKEDKELDEALILIAIMESKCG